MTVGGVPAERAVLREPRRAAGANEEAVSLRLKSEVAK